MTGRLDDAHDVFEDVVVDVDALSDAAQREDVIAGEHGETVCARSRMLTCRRRSTLT